jgi:hypothetical protein
VLRGIGSDGHHHAHAPPHDGGGGRPADVLLPLPGSPGTRRAGALVSGAAATAPAGAAATAATAAPLGASTAAIAEGAAAGGSGGAPRVIAHVLQTALMATGRASATAPQLQAVLARWLREGLEPPLGVVGGGGGAVGGGRHQSCLLLPGVQPGGMRAWGGWPGVCRLLGAAHVAAAPPVSAAARETLLSRAGGPHGLAALTAALTDPGVQGGGLVAVAVAVRCGAVRCGGGLLGVGM